jgi:beta-1,4-N-acetylglucosaminyltransferase
VNGPGVCIPPCLIAFILKVIGLKHVSIVFIESLARVKKLSLTGKILLPIADRFLVQWPYLKGSIAEYHGRLV